MNLWLYSRLCNTTSGIVSTCVTPVSILDLEREDREFAFYKCHKYCRGSHPIGFHGRCSVCGLPNIELVDRK